MFTMRHMEIYIKLGATGWNCALEKDNNKPLLSLRVKYLTTIATTDINEHRHKNMTKAQAFEKEKA